MALTVRDFDVMQPSWMFFGNLFDQIASAEAEMEAMRRRMFRLFPRDLVDMDRTQIQHHEPAVVEEGGETKLKMEFDVHKFKPEEVKVKIVGDNVLQVSAVHEHKTEHGFEKRQFMRHYTLPEGVDPASIKPVMSKDGVLSIEAPAPSLKPQERTIPIEHHVPERIEEKKH